jgi:predicted phosphodiesterase
MSIVTWIHLSDWHYGEAENTAIQDQVRQALAQDVDTWLRTPYQYVLPGGIKKELYLEGRADFIFFSGDASFRGKAAGFQGAKKLIEDVRNAAQVPAERVFIVPGNHDLDRNAIQTMPPSLQTSLINAPLEVVQPLVDGEHLPMLRRPFQDFRDFCQPYAFIEPDVSTMVRGSLEDRAVDYSISGFNSALYCGRPADYQGQKRSNDYGGLILAEYQNALPRLPEARLEGARPHLKVALIHHPFYWLHPDVQTPIIADFIANFHFILMGHEHRPRLNWMSEVEGEVVYIPAGATFQQDRDTLEVRRPLEEMGIAYNIVHLDLQQGVGYVFLRLYRKEKGKLGFFTDNRDRAGWPNGVHLLEHLPGCDLPTKQTVSPVEQLLAHGETIDIRLPGTIDPSQVIDFLSPRLPTKALEPTPPETAESADVPAPDADE